VHREGRERRALLAALCPPGEVVVDVGADHGHVARAVGGIATERLPERIALRGAERWVVADGLRPFRRVDVAIVAGMGAKTIARILSEGPRPSRAVLHAQDDPPALRRWLAANGWRIVREGLAREAGRYAEVSVVEPGEERATGFALDYGPRLLADGDPLLADHLGQVAGWLAGLLRATEGRPAPRRQEWEDRLAFVRSAAERLRPL
jgi:tRNA (adenine22-N1)-methyltransferase